MKCCLSGMPELKLGIVFSLFSLSSQGLNDKVRFDLGEGSQKRKVGGSNGNNIDLEDVRFHQVYLHL